MARRAMITPLTIYNQDNTIFDGLTLPDYHFPRAIEYDDLFLREGWTLDKQILIDNILLETAELDTIYTDPDFLKFAISAWARKEFPVWRSLYETLFYKYNPIWNKDGSIKETESQIRDLVLKNSKTISHMNATVNNESENIDDTDNTVESGTHNEARNNVRVNNKDEVTDSTTENKVSAFDSMSTYTPRDKSDTDTEVSTGENETSVENLSGGEDGTTDRTYNRNRSNINNRVDNGTETEDTENTDSGTIDRNNTRFEFGNIGVTTTQQMIQAERDLVKFNIYDFIIDSFKARFCVLIY